MSDRPTTDPKIAVLDAFDQACAQLVDRLDGLDDDEYLWEPVAGTWSVRPSNDGAVVEGAEVALLRDLYRVR